ncbi:MAG: hypothetical protein KDI11_00945 [Alphaproteobacteria bacterium]|nr:hypothetical protein [Alphaproteobacteria bacterium]
MLIAIVLVGNDIQGDDDIEADPGADPIPVMYHLRRGIAPRDVAYYGRSRPIVYRWAPGHWLSEVEEIGDAA